MPLLDPPDTLASVQPAFGLALFLKPFGHTGLAAITFRVVAPLVHQMVFFATKTGVAGFALGDGVTFEVDAGSVATAELALLNFTTIVGLE